MLKSVFAIRSSAASTSGLVVHGQSPIGAKNATKISTLYIETRFVNSVIPTITSKAEFSCRRYKVTSSKMHCRFPLHHGRSFLTHSRSHLKHIRGCLTCLTQSYSGIGSGRFPIDSQISTTVSLASSSRVILHLDWCISEFVVLFPCH